jgi:hypothetical protein
MNEIEQSQEKYVTKTNTRSLAMRWYPPHLHIFKAIFKHIYLLKYIIWILFLLKNCFPSIVESYQNDQIGPANIYLIFRMDTSIELRSFSWWALLSH